MTGRVDQQAIVAKRRQDRGCLRRRLSRQLADRFLALRKLVVEKPRQNVIERIGPRRTRAKQKRDDAERSQEALV
jgi:hypothetical protein